MLYLYQVIVSVFTMHGIFICFLFTTIVYTENSKCILEEKEKNNKIWVSSDTSILDILVDEDEWETTLNIKESDVIWVTRNKHYDEEVRRVVKKYPNKPINKLHGHRKITSKVELTKTLKESDYGYLQPITYTIETISDCIDFFESNKMKQCKIWVVKPSSESRGVGIHIIPNYKDLEIYYGYHTTTSTCSNIKNIGITVAQCHIDKPILLDGKKSEIRTYWLMKRNKKGDDFDIYYHDGTVRRTTEDYTNSDWGNALKHITNTYQQKKYDNDYSLKQDERKWSLKQLESYLQKDNNWLNNQLRPCLMSMIQSVYIASKDHFIKKNKGYPGRFELFGMDVILEDWSYKDIGELTTEQTIIKSLYPETILEGDIKVWLTEIQTGPGLSMDTTTKKKELPNMIRGLFNIILDNDDDGEHYKWIKISNDDDFY